MGQLGGHEAEAQKKEGLWDAGGAQELEADTPVEDGAGWSSHPASAGHWLCMLGSYFTFLHSQLP